MILRSISVRGWRCFAGEVRLGPFSHRINVIHGPNGTGKTTLFQAMARGFLDAHRVSGEEAEAMRPWGRTLGPRVTVEFVHGGEEYRLEKRFLDRPSSELFRRERGTFVRLAEADAADERLRQFLRATAPGRGLSDTRHWGTAQVLWTRQGDLSFGELTGDLPNDIRAMLGAQVAGEAGSRLEQKLASLYGQYFTRTGRSRTGQQAPEAARLKEEKKQAEERLRDAREKLELFDSMSRRLEDLRARQDQLRREAAALSAAVADARKRAQAYAALRAERERRLEREKRTESQAKALKRAIDEIEACASEQARTQQERANLAEDLPLRAQEVAQAEAVVLQRKAYLENARASRLEVEAAREQAEAARQYLDRREKAGALEARLGELRKAESELDHWRGRRGRLLAPDAAALRKIRKAIKDRDEADLLLSAALISLEIVPARDCSLTVLAGETPGHQAVRAGAAGQFRGSPEVVVEIEGFGRIRASGPAGSVEEYRQKREAAIRQLKSLTEAFSTTDPDSLESLHQRAAEIDRQIEQVRVRLETLLAGETPEGIEQQLAMLARLLASAEEAHPEWRETPPDAKALQAAADKLASEFDAAVRSAEGAWEAAESLRTAAERKHAEVAARLQEADKRIDDIRKRLATLTADGRSDRQRREELETALLAWEAAQTARAQADRELEAWPGDPADELERLQRQLEAAENAARNALAEEKHEEGVLARLALEGPHSLVAEAEEHLAGVSARLARETMRMQAIKLLWDTYASAKEAAVAVVTAPVEAAATRILERIAGRGLGGIRLNESFRPEGLRPELAEQQIALGEASGGEQEQIFFATRLALAEVIAGQERPLVILDDALTASDSGRLVRALRVLEEAAEKMQVVILTCHPERYRALQDANFFDLEEIISASRRIS